MSLTAADYKKVLQDLMPKGAAWRIDVEDTTLNKVLDAVSEEYARLDARIQTLLEEADPRTTLELLSDWERVMGLPDPCTELAETTEARRNALVTKLNLIGQQTPQYYIDIAAAQGFVITITEFEAWTVNDTITTPMKGTNWLHWFQVNAPLNSFTYFRTTSPVTDALRDWGNDALECLINTYKPAHTQVIFSYT